MTYLRLISTCSFKRQTPFFLLTILFCAFFVSESIAQKLNIKNDSFWDTRDGKPIYSQGGGVFTFKDPKTGLEKYYWYGVHYKEAETYRNSPNKTLPRASFESVSCYTSTDLVNWTSEGEAMTKAEAMPDGRWTWVGRLGVAYVKESNQYAMFVQHGAQVLIAVADNPAGPFKWHQKISMLERIGTTNTGDQTVFTDEDTGKSYLVYSYGRGRHRIYISEIGMKDGKVDLLDCTRVFAGAGREGNCMFKYQGKYYMAASNLYGWDASLAYYLVADDIRGPYEPVNNMLVMDGASEDYAHVTQTGFFVSVKGSKQETIVYCGDRWADIAGNGLGYNQWVPLSFDGAKPYFNSLGSWNLDAKTGEWDVAPDNNYVRNGSFEADRKNIPSPTKPEQTYLIGWKTTVLSGNQVSLDSLSSPVINYANSEEERKTVIGERSLNISDNVPFERLVSQTISSSPYVKLKDGFYKMKATIRNNGGFSQLEMFAESTGRRVTQKVKGGDSQWKTIELSRIHVRNGRVDIGFKAKGNAGASCQVDDISLIIEK
jgi:hypothetical protein